MRNYLGDLLVRIKNAQKARLPEMKMHPYLPKHHIMILCLLYREGYIRGFKEYWDISEKKVMTKVLLKYNVRGEPVIENIFSISKPGRRVFVNTKTLWQPKTTRGIFILSTTKGFLVDRDARFLNVGGELLLGVY